MVYNTQPRYQLTVRYKGTTYHAYFGMRPSAQDYIKHNCQNSDINLTERLADGSYASIYQAQIDAHGKAIKYQGEEIDYRADRKEG